MHRIRACALRRKQIVTPCKRKICVMIGWDVCGDPGIQHGEMAWIPGAQRLSVWKG